MEITLLRAGLSDAEIIWNMQKLAFADMLEKYRDYDTSPAAEPLSKTQNRLGQPFTYFYLIYADGKVVGAIRVVDKMDGSPKILSPLFILPGYRKRGYATSAISEAEKIHGQKGWQLDTVLQETATCRLYEKLGYRQTGEQKVINSRLTLVFYEK